MDAWAQHIAYSIGDITSPTPQSGERTRPSTRYTPTMSEEAGPVEALKCFGFLVRARCAPRWAGPTFHETMHWQPHSRTNKSDIKFSLVRTVNKTNKKGHGQGKIGHFHIQLHHVHGHKLYLLAAVTTSKMNLDILFPQMFS